MPNVPSSSAACPALGRIPPACRAMPGFAAPKLMWVARHEPEVFARIAHVLMPKDYRPLPPDGAAGDRHVGRRRLALAGRGAARLVAGDRSPRPGCRCRRCRRWSTVPDRGRHRAARSRGGARPFRRRDRRRRRRRCGGRRHRHRRHRGWRRLRLASARRASISSSTTDYRPCPEALVHAFAHALPGRWFQMGAMLNGASALAWAASLVGEADIGRLLGEASRRRGAASPDLIFLPYLVGERTPHDDPHARGVFFGLDPTTDRAALIRAVPSRASPSPSPTRSDAMAAAGPVRPGSARPAAARAARSGCRSSPMYSVLPIVTYRGGAKGPAFGAARLAHPRRRRRIAGRDLLRAAGARHL